MIIIAEIGWNHMGDLKIAENMIIEAKKSGANYAKFQTWSVDRLKKGAWDEDGRREIYISAELSEAKHKSLINLCNKNEIEFFSSVFSIPDAELLRNLGIKVVKIPSFEISNLELLEFCKKNFETIYLSTGTSTWDEVQNLKNIFHDLSQIVVMHCVSSYPCNAEVINLPKINYLKNEFPFVGFSDHTQGVEISKIALTYELDAIEKHFTIDQNLPGRDNKFAILPAEFIELKEFHRKLLLSNEFKGLDYQDCELDTRNNYRGRFNG